MFSRLPRLFLASFLMLGSGCTNLVSGITSQLADDLAGSILNSEDIDTVREGVPAYLLLMDSFLRSSPDSEDLLLAASNLNGSFSALVVDEDQDKTLQRQKYAICRARCLCFKITSLRCPPAKLRRI